MVAVMRPFGEVDISPFEVRHTDSALSELARPVSYTHLDVYKRQGKKRVAEKNVASDGRYKYGIGVSLGVYGCGLDGVDASS